MSTEEPSTVPASRNLPDTAPVRQIEALGNADIAAVLAQFSEDVQYVDMSNPGPPLDLRAFRVLLAAFIDSYDWQKSRVDVVRYATHDNLWCMELSFDCWTHAATNQPARQESWHAVVFDTVGSTGQIIEERVYSGPVQVRESA